MKTVNLNISSDDKEEIVILSFNLQEIKTLNHYAENCERLSNAPLLQAFPAVQHIKWDFNDGSVKFDISEFQYEQVYDLLHRARPIFLHQEPASFNRTKAIFSRKSKGTILAKMLKDIRLTYEKGEYQKYFQVCVGKMSDSAEIESNKWREHALDALTNKTSSRSMNTDSLFHESTLDAWLNGVEYHQDADKAEMIKRIEERLTQETARGIFVAQMSGRLKAIFWLDQLSKIILDSEVDISKEQINKNDVNTNVS